MRLRQKGAAKQQRHMLGFRQTAIGRAAEATGAQPAGCQAGLHKKKASGCAHLLKSTGSPAVEPNLFPAHRVPRPDPQQRHIVLRNGVARQTLLPCTLHPRQTHRVSRCRETTSASARSTKSCLTCWAIHIHASSRVFGQWSRRSQHPQLDRRRSNALRSNIQHHEWLQPIR